MEEPKKSKLNINRVIIVVIILFAIIILVKNGIYTTIFEKERKETKLLFDNEMISLNDKINIENDEIYLSKEDVQNIFDDTIYYNVGDKELITTHNKHVAVMHLDENQIKINDTLVQTENSLKEIEGKIYLPMKELEMVYDVEAEYSQKSNRVIINSITKAKYQALALKNIKIKATRVPFSVGIENVKRGDYLYVLEEKGSWQKVRTENGNIGYIKTRNISDKEVLREDLEEENEEINILEEYGDFSKNYEQVELDSKKDNVVILEDFAFSKNKELTSSINVSSEQYSKYHDWAESNEIDILGEIKNKSVVSDAFATYEQRNEIIGSIYNKVMEKQYKGIAINFEDIDDINSFNRFLIEITPKFKESGLKVIVKLNDQMDKKKVKSIVDFCY